MGESVARGKCIRGKLRVNSLIKELLSEDKTKNDKRNEIRLEFVQIDVQGTSKAKRNSDRRDDLSDQSIQIGETR
jgi:hypothetical protein